MADITIEAGLEASHYLAGQRTGIIWTSDQIGYAFFITSTANAAGPFKYSKTTDGGQTWAADVTIDASNSVRYAVWYDKETSGNTGTKIHTANFNWDDNHLWYRNLDTASDTLGTAIDVGSITGANDMSGTYEGTGYLSIAKARSGNLGILAYSGMSNGPWFYRSTDGGGTWGSRSNGWSESDESDRGQLIPAADTDANDFACIFLDDSANELSFKLYDDSANTWGNETVISSGLMTGAWPTTYWGFDVSVRHSDNKAIIAYWTDENTATADLNVSVLTLTAAGANSTALTAIATNLNAAGEVCVMINGNNDDIYVAWVAGGTWDSLTDIDHTVSTDAGSTWASTTQFSETQDDLRRVHCMSIIASGQSGRWMPVWENDDLLDLVSNYANSVSISAGGSGMTGTIAATVTKATAALAGTKSYTGTAAATLQKLTAALSGAMQPSGAAAATLQAATAAAAGTQTQTGTIAATLTKATAATAGTQVQTGTAAATLSMATASASGVMQPTGAAAATLTKATAALAGTHTGTSPEGTAAATLHAVTAALAGTQTQTGAAAASLQPATAALTGTQQFIGQVAATLQVATAALAGTHSQTGSLAATLQILTVALLGSQTQTGTIAATLQAATAALAETVAAATPTPIPMTGSYSPSIAMTGSLLAANTGSYSHPAMTGSVGD